MWRKYYVHRFESVNTAVFNFVLTINACTICLYRITFSDVNIYFSIYLLFKREGTEYLAQSFPYPMLSRGSPRGSYTPLGVSISRTPAIWKPFPAGWLLCWDLQVPCSVFKETSLFWGLNSHSSETWLWWLLLSKVFFKVQHWRWCKAMTILQLSMA